MSELPKAIISWSGGKDCTLALHHVLKQNIFKVEYLFVTINKAYQRVSMHGVRKELITRQGMSIGIHTRKLYLPETTTNEWYQKMMEAEMLLMQHRGIHDVIFGDIFLQDLKNYRETQLSKIQMNAHFPLWNRNTKDIYKEFIAFGYKAKIISVNLKKLSKEFLGKDLTLDLINDFPLDVDVCGENGEFHTFVYDGPIFHYPINIQVGEVVEKHYTHNDESIPYAFLDLNIT